MVLLCFHACTHADVKTDFDPAADFNRFQVFAFAGLTDPSSSEVSGDSQARKRIESIIAEELTNKGLRQVELNENPDVLIHYVISIKDKQVVQSSNPAGTGYGWRGGYGSGSGYGAGGYRPSGGYGLNTTYEYKEGTLIIDLVEPGEKELIWRATIVANLQDQTEENMELAKEGIVKAFKEYPPNKERH
jgi:hypothetical protein